MEISPLAKRRLDSFRAHRRGYWSMWIFIVLFGMSLFSELIANDKPFLAMYKGEFYYPIFQSYPETAFGGEFETEADYKDPYVQELIENEGWMVWPPIRYNHRTVAWELSSPAPSSPDREHWLGTDDQARDVVARSLYGFRISVLFGFTLTIISAIVGVAAGAVQGYFGGWPDLLFQRFIEVWAGLPTLYLLIILASVVEPNFWWLLGLLLLFSWMGFVGVVRAEFLRAPKFRLCTSGSRTGSKAFQDYFSACSSECDGGDNDLHAIYSGGVCYGTDFTGFSWHRATAGVGFTR